MSRLSIVTSTAIAALGVTALSSQAIAQQTLRQQLVGTWTLASCDVKAPWCPGSGSWAFGGNGRYTLVIQGPRPKVSGTGPVNRTAVSAEEYKAIGQGNVSQFGTWSVNEADKTLTQHVESSFFGRSDGTDVKISISLTGDELKVSGTGGTETWKKTPPPQQTLRQQIVGTWNLVSCDNKDQLVCASPNGIVSYDATGHYSQMFVPKGRKVDIPQGTTRATLSAERYKEVAQGVISNFGTFSVDEPTKEITFKREGALFPTAEGTEAKGTIVSLTGDDLKAKGPILGNSTWRRAK